MRELRLLIISALVNLISWLIPADCEEGQIIAQYIQALSIHQRAYLEQKHPHLKERVR